jgi:hypothetical protein
MNRVIQTQSPRRPAALRLAGGLALVLAVVAAVVPARAGGRVAVTPSAQPDPMEFMLLAPPAPPPMPTLAGDETIGSLPILGPAQAFGLVDAFHDANACLYVQGQRFDVLNTVAGYLGSGLATLEVLDDVTDTVRVVFHGQTTLKLDRELVDLGLVELGIETPLDFGSVVIQAKFHHRALPQHELTAGTSAFAPALLALTHMHQGRFLRMSATGPNSGVTSLSLRSSRRFLYVGQTVH